jgi:hypothetical protein
MEIKEMGPVIYSHSDTVETNHSKPCIRLSPYTDWRLLWLSYLCRLVCMGGTQ